MNRNSTKCVSCVVANLSTHSGAFGIVWHVRINTAVMTLEQMPTHSHTIKIAFEKSRASTYRTTMMHWLREHDDIEMYGHEIRYLVEERPAEFVSLLYNLSEGSYYKRGYKQPNEIVRPKGFRYLQKHWPRTKLIVGVRHPVTWLQSFVSFKIRNGKGDNMKKLLQHYVDGEAIPTTIRYHVHLSQLGMTNATDPREAVLLGSHAFHVPKMPTQVFLYENSQPFDATDNHHVQFANDMTEFLGLSYPLHPLVREDTKYTDVGVDICEDKYADLRQRLIDEGRKAATWIVEFFLKSPDVTTSNRSHFETRLMTWSSDPCMKG